jgi:hypothetical protein
MQENTLEFYAIKDSNTQQFFNGSRGQASQSFSGNSNLPPKLYKKGPAKSVMTQFKKYRIGADKFDLRLIKVTLVLEELDIGEK